MSKQAEFRSVDFIGLKRLLGYWWTTEGFLDVRTFSLMNFYDRPGSSVSAGDLPNVAPRTDSIKKSYQYSVTPSSGVEWVVFLNDKETVYFTQVTFQGANAQMKVYNSESGALEKTINLLRLNP